MQDEGPVGRVGQVGRVGRRVGVALAALLMAASAGAQPAPCDRGCLESMLDAYVDAVAARAPARVPVAAGVVFTENGQRLETGRRAVAHGHRPRPLRAAAGRRRGRAGGADGHDPRGRRPRHPRRASQGSRPSHHRNRDAGHPQRGCGEESRHHRHAARGMDAGGARRGAAFACRAGAHRQPVFLRHRAQRRQGQLPDCRQLCAARERRRHRGRPRAGARRGSRGSVTGRGDRCRAPTSRVPAAVRDAACSTT